MDNVNVPMHEARGRERPDYTTFQSPVAAIVDDASEEIEIDQALSLQGRRGRDFLGWQLGGVLGDFGTEHQTITAADHEMSVLWRLASRTGTFGIHDPELIDSKVIQAVTQFITGTATDAFLTSMVLDKEMLLLGEPFLYVAPRLFARLDNFLDVTIVANAFQNRMGSVAVPLTFNLFIELLERFADVTLL